MKTQLRRKGPLTAILILAALPACHPQELEVEASRAGLGGDAPESIPSAGGSRPGNGPGTGGAPSAGSYPGGASATGGSPGKVPTTGGSLGGAPPADGSLGGAPGAPEEACPDGTFGDASATSCIPHTLCAWDEAVVAPGTPTTDTACEPGSVFRQFGTDWEDGATDVALAPDGGVYVTGSTRAFLPPNAVGKTKAFLRRYDAQGRVVWARQLGNPAVEHFSQIAVDDLGHVVVLRQEVEESGPSVARLSLFDEAGSHLWQRNVAASGSSVARALGLDASGNIFVAGSTNQALDGQPMEDADVFVRKYDPEGELLWGQRLGSAAAETANGLAVTLDGGVRVVGRTAGSLHGPSHGGEDAFLWALDEDGAELWIDQFGTDRNDWATAVALRPSSIYVTGATEGALEGDSATALDVFVRELDGEGNELRTVQLGVEGAIEGVDLVVDEERLHILAETRVGTSEAEHTDVVLLTYDGQGLSVPWLSFGTDQNELAAGIAADGAGHVFVAGRTYGTLVGKNLGAGDAFVARFELPTP